MKIRLELTGVLLLAVAACDNPPEAGFTVSALTSPAAMTESVDPALAVDPVTGDLLLSWVGGDSTGWALYFARSTDQGKTWSAPASVTNPEERIRPQGESSPRLVAASEGRIALAWVGVVEVPGRKWPATEIRLAHSDDGGVTWSGPTTLNDDTTRSPAGHQFHGAAWRGDSGLVVSWLDEREGAALEVHHGEASPTAGDPTDEPDAVIYTAASPDFGRTWEPSNRLMWGQVCPCCRVTLARGPDGGVVSAWRKHYPGNIRDVVTASLGEGEVAEPVRVNQDNWVYPGCPYTGPGVSVDSSGASHVVWYMGKEGQAGVYYQRVLAQQEASEAPVALIQARTLPSAHTTVAALPGGRALAAYDRTETGERAVSVSLIGADRAVLERHLVAGSEGGQYPQVVATGPGQAVVAWIARMGERREVRLAAIKFGLETDGARVALKE